jgi:hypothetical protein
MNQAVPTDVFVNNHGTPWATSIAEETLGAKCTTLGLTNGSRAPSNRRVIDNLARMLYQQLKQVRDDTEMLVVRLNVFKSRSLDRQDDQPAGAPWVTRSALGPWSEVNIPVPVGKTASWSLQQIPEWMTLWKSSHSFVLLDLGAMHWLPSRMVGRLCDSCYILLGPDACASHEWILQHVAWHDRSGSTICGTIVASRAA